MTPPAKTASFETCPGCWGRHPPDSQTVYVDYAGRRFHPPFLCLCCGRAICARQFAFGTMCGYCDCGRCKRGLRPWRAGDPALGRRVGVVVVYEPGHGDHQLRFEEAGIVIPDYPGQSQGRRP